MLKPPTTTRVFSTTAQLCPHLLLPVCGNTHQTEKMNKSWFWSDLSCTKEGQWLQWPSLYSTI